MSLRLCRMTISGFRGFGREQEFLFGPTNIFGGPNGFGKTSIFDAIQWCLFGRVIRLSGTRDFIRAGDVYRNLFVGGTPSVSLEFRTASGEIAHRRRSGGQCSSQIDGKSSSDRTFLDHIGMPARDPEAVFLRNHMLQQETIDQFLRDLNPRERYDSMLYLLADETPRALLEALKILTDQCQVIQTQENINLVTKKDRREKLERDILELENINANLTLDLMQRQFTDLLSESGTNFLDSLGYTSRQVLDASSISHEIKNFFSKLNETLGQMNEVSARLARLRPVMESQATPPDAAAADSELRNLQETAENTRHDFQEVQVEFQKTQLLVEQLTTLIEIESKATGRTRAILAEVKDMIDTDSCPVCKRPIPQQILRETIDAAIGSIGRGLTDSVARRRESESQLEVLRSRERRLSEVLAKAIARINEVRDLQGQRQAAHTSFNNIRNLELSTRWGLKGLEFDAFGKAVDQDAQRIETIRRRASDLLSQLEQLKSIELLSKRRDEFAAAQIEENSTAAKRDGSLRAVWILGNLGEAVNKARSNMVSSILQSYKPTIQSFYLRFHVHPVFSQIDFEIVKAYKDTELFFKVSPRGGSPSANPSTVFSASQLNVLAVSIFLALNLKSPAPLDLMFLDDPIQAMDDINVLGFCEVLRQLKSKRQLFVSTHSPDLYNLLRSKLRPEEGESPLRAFWFSSWSSDGPTIYKEEDEHLGSRFGLGFVEELTKSHRKAS